MGFWFGFVVGFFSALIIIPWALKRVMKNKLEKTVMGFLGK